LSFCVNSWAVTRLCSSTNSRDKLTEHFGLGDKPFAISTVQRAITDKLGFSLLVLSYKAIQQCDRERAIYRAVLATVSDPAMFCFLDECAVGKKCLAA
jgi:hypothetical protein